MKFITYMQTIVDNFNELEDYSVIHQRGMPRFDEIHWDDIGIAISVWRERGTVLENGQQSVLVDVDGMLKGRHYRIIKHSNAIGLIVDFDDKDVYHGDQTIDSVRDIVLDEYSQEQATIDSGGEAHQRD